MIRVLQCVNIMDRAGLETMLMNYYRNINRDEIQFDFLTHRSETGAYDDEIRSLGGKVYHAPRLYPQNYPAYFRWMRDFFKEHPEYRIVHSHIDSMSYFPLRAAANAGVPVRIAHSHNSKLGVDLKFPIKYFALKMIPRVATERCACGEMAGKFMYHDSDFKIIRNAIDTNGFFFNEEIRNRKRKEFGFDDKIVIGHVGRFNYVKNQLFLLDVLRYILAKDSRYHLVLVGKGEDQNKIEKKIRKLSLNDNVSIFIDRSDVDEIYQAMDIFVMPSLFEGVPVVAIEAQTNGLACLMSDRISKEVLITNNIKMINLKSGPQIWGDEIIKAIKKRNMDACKEVSLAGYSIYSEAIKLQNWYKDLYQTKVESAEW